MLITNQEIDTFKIFQSECRPTNDFLSFERSELKQSVVKRFEDQVAKYPEKIAVKTLNNEISYNDLNKEANRLANYLIEHNSEKTETIALLMDHGLPMIIGMLGVLKSGKIYVPLDNSYTEEKNALILQDSDAKIIISDDKNEVMVKGLAGDKYQVINIDKLNSNKIENPNTLIYPDNLAYILYTSGSTGQPKGVMQNHRNLLHIVMLYTNDIHLCMDDHLSFIYSHSFAAGVKDIYGALLNGATVCTWNVKEKGVVKLPEWLVQNNITIFHSIPTVFRHLCQELNEEQKNLKLRLISLGSEPITKRDFELYQKFLPSDCLFHIELGSTETGVIRQYFANKKSDFPTNKVILGYDVKDKELVLLDSEKEEDDTLVGEIAIKSHYLSPGYWKRSDLSEKSFIEISDNGGYRIYRTGDLGRILPDGCLEYLGRKDFQVKVRGQRIDILVIENSLAELESIEEAVVLPFEDRQGNTNLVAYCVPVLWPGPTFDELRNEAAKILSDSMIPSRFEMIRFMPRNPNGKIDRLALKDSVEDLFDESEEIIPPRNPIEKILIKFFVELLSLEEFEVGIHQNFFQLGGNSLSAVQLYSRIQDAFKMDLKISDIFNSPTVSSLSELLTQNIQNHDIIEKTAEDLIKQSLFSKNNECQIPAKTKISRKQCTGHIPLSSFQQSFWFLQQANPDNPFYNWASLFRLSGELDIISLKRAFTEVINRHESLRTIFTIIDDKPCQTVLPQVDLPFTILDLNELPLKDREEKAMNHIDIEARIPFNLSQGPLIRITVICLNKNEHLLLVVLHHIICDGWSMGIFFKEFSDFYQLFNSNKQIQYNELPIQYTDFTLWQHEYLKKDIFIKLLDYWKEQLSGIQNLDISTDYPRPVVERYCGSHYSFKISKELTEKLTVLSRQEGKTLFMILLAVYQTLFYRYTRQEDIAVGVPMAIRNREEVEGLFGMLSNTLVMRTDFSNNPTFCELLNRVKKVVMDAIANQEMPFEKLVEQLHPERTLSHNPLFQVSFEYENFSEPIPQLPGVKAESIKVHNGTSKFDLTLNMIPSDQCLLGSIEYNSDLFNNTTIVQLAKHLQRLFEVVVENPESHILDISLIDDEEWKKLVVECNQTVVSFPQDQCIHQLFESQAKKTPDKVAVFFQNKSYTYAELNAKSNQLACYLQQNFKIGPDILVGVFVERSLDMVVAILSILKAGGAYVPLDPSFPKERLGYMAKDSRIPVLLTQQSLIDNLPETDAAIICLDSDWEKIVLQTKNNLLREVGVNNSAYVIYTSGSTGRPKGVQIEHRSVVNFLNSMHREPGLTDNDILLSVTTLSFDISILEIFLPICVGAQLVLASKEETFDSKLLLKRLSSCNATVMQATPATWRLLIENDRQGNKDLKVLCGGEALSRELANNLLQRYGSVWNLYGPTETTIWSAIHKIEYDDGPILIGRPIDNTQIYILDNQNQLVPFGVPGELCIGGTGLARSYLNQPELTAEKFIPDTFSGNPGARIYKTGDLARRLADGTIEVLGRLDHQIKIRGFRIELGEIEAVLVNHPSVKEAVVVVKGDTQESKRLVAYIITDKDSSEWIDQKKNLSSKVISQWQSIWDGNYGQGLTEKDPKYNFLGWNNSYTGKPIQEEEMSEWIDLTCKRILSLKPDRVLEIGVGLGLILFRIAPHCAEYYGIDFSKEAIEYLNKHIDNEKNNLKNITLLHKAAHDLEPLKNDFNLVILNSIIQYFPDENYLLRVLDRAINLIEKGGSIFVGDVRSLSLLKIFHTSVQLYKAPSSFPVSQLKEIVQQQIAHENELIINPIFFEMLKDRYPRIGNIKILLKRGHFSNELTKFRYDVIINIESKTDHQEIIWRDWNEEKLNITDIKRYLTENQPDIFGIKNIVNARLSKDLKAIEFIEDDRFATVGDIRKELQKFTPDGIEPEEIWSLEDDLPYVIEITIAESDSIGSFDIIFRKKNNELNISDALAPEFIVKKQSDILENDFANQPLLNEYIRTLIPEIRKYLKENLPEYMVPSIFQFVSKFPLTPNGKIDRKSLPSPDGFRPDHDVAYVSPKNEAERKVCEVWKEVLNLEKVGRDDNFFNLGGHSLQLPQVSIKLKKLFNIEIPIVELFRYPTVSSLAEYFTQENKEDKESEFKNRLEDRASRKNKAIASQKRERSHVDE